MNCPIPVAHPALPRAGSLLPILRNRIARWDQSHRFRQNLDRMAKTHPHLIADIGMTSGQAEAEIAKPFWKT